MKYKWLHFWNVRFDKAFGRFVNHFGQVCDLDEKGKQKKPEKTLSLLGDAFRNVCRNVLSFHVQNRRSLIVRRASFTGALLFFVYILQGL